MPADMEGSPESAFGRGLWELLPAPLKRPKLSGLVGEAWRWCQAVGEQAERVLTAIGKVRSNRHPATCDDAFLPIHARERGLPRLPGESLYEWRRRLREAFSLHQEGGTNAGVIRALKVFGFPDPQIYEHRPDAVRYDGSHSYDGSWTYGGWLSWAHFSVLLEALEDGVSAEVLGKVRAAVRKVKAGHAMLGEIRLTVPEFATEAASAVEEMALTTEIGGELEDEWVRPGRRYDGSWLYDGSAKYDGADDWLSVSVV